MIRVFGGGGIATAKTSKKHACCYDLLPVLSYYKLTTMRNQYICL